MNGMVWILFVILGSTDDNSAAVTSQEFNSQQACEEAKKELFDKLVQNHEFVTKTLLCIPKGQDDSPQN